MFNFKLNLKTISILALIFASFLFSSQAFCQGNIKGCSKDEKDVIGAVSNNLVIARKHIIFVCPENLVYKWYPESEIDSPEKMADWLEKIYVLSMEWISFDPNKCYAKRNGRIIRLIFIDKGNKDFQFGGKSKRPYIGLVDLVRDKDGTDEDRLGWFTHELSHDFWHENPDFKSVKDPWGEAMCDFERYWLLKESGMPIAAERWLQRLKNANPKDKYRGGAWILLDYQLKNFKSPKEFWRYLKGKDFDAVFGKPLWKE